MLRNPLTSSEPAADATPPCTAGCRTGRGIVGADRAFRSTRSLDWGYDLCRTGLISPPCSYAWHEASSNSDCSTGEAALIVHRPQQRAASSLAWRIALLREPHLYACDTASWRPRNVIPIAYFCMLRNRLIEAGKLHFNVGFCIVAYQAQRTLPAPPQYPVLSGCVSASIPSS